MASARGYLGTPFAHQGRNPAAGLDCAGLCIRVGHDLGLLAPGFDFTVYKRYPDMGTIKRLCQEHLNLKPVAAREPGDVLVFTLEHWPCHMGIYAGRTADGRELLVHSYQPAKGVCEHTYDDTWLGHTVACYSFKDVD